MLSCTHQQDSSKKARAFLLRLKNEQKIATSVFCREKCFSLVLILLARDSSALIQRMRGARRQKYVAKTKYKISYGGLPQVQRKQISLLAFVCVRIQKPRSCRSDIVVSRTLRHTVQQICILCAKPSLN